MFSSASFHTKTIKILSRHFSNGNFCFHSFLDFQINYIGDFVRYILDVPISDNLHIRSQLLFVFLHFFCIALSPLPGCIQVSGGFQFTAYFGIKGYVQRALAIVRLEIQIKPESFLFLLFLNGSSFPFLQHSIEIGVRLLLASSSDCYLEFFLIQHLLNWKNTSAKKRKTDMLSKVLVIFCPVSILVKRLLKIIYFEPFRKYRQVSFCKYQLPIAFHSHCYIPDYQSTLLQMITKQVSNYLSFSNLIYETKGTNENSVREDCQ